MGKLTINIDDSIYLDVYLHLVHDNDIFYDVEFLYGGRDSGKSRHIAMQLIIECMKPGYFKCLMIRKILKTVRDSQYSLIKSIIEKWGLTNQFSINETRLEIIYKKTGNGFYGRGLDNVAGIKSFNDPSHCWIEEGNQISNEDFVVILTSLRCNFQQVKTWFSFNPECDENYTDFWLYKEYFEHTTKLSWNWTKMIEVPNEDDPANPDMVPIRIRATHSTYKNNPYCPATRKALYESYKLSKNNAYWYQTYTLGLWGYRKTGGAFWKCFEEEKHATTKAMYNKLLPVHLTLDNNVTPYITIGIWQVNQITRQIYQVDELPCESPDNTAAKAAKRTIKWLEKQEHEGGIFIYGDPSANAKSTEDDEGRSFFDKFLGVFTKSGIGFVNRVGKSAPGVSISADFINEIYESNYGGWSIGINTKCRKAIEDYVMTKEDENGNVLKKREKNKETGQTFERYGHFSDSKRYFLVKLLPQDFAIYSQRRKKYFAKSS